MPSSLFAPRAPRQQQNRRNELETAVGSIMGMIRGQNPQKFLQALCMRDPQIRSTVQRWQGMSAEDICAECGVDYGWLRNLIK